MSYKDERMAEFYNAVSKIIGSFVGAILIAIIVIEFTRHFQENKMPVVDAFLVVVFITVMLGISGLIGFLF